MRMHLNFLIFILEKLHYLKSQKEVKNHVYQDKINKFA